LRPAERLLALLKLVEAPREPGDDRPVGERELARARGGDRDVVAEDGAQIVEAALLAGDRDQPPVAVFGRAPPAGESAAARIDNPIAGASASRATRPPARPPRRGNRRVPSRSRILITRSLRRWVGLCVDASHPAVRRARRVRRMRLATS
jgi:hypothetical protein